MTAARQQVREVVRATQAFANVVAKCSANNNSSNITTQHHHGGQHDWTRLSAEKRAEWLREGPGRERGRNKRCPATDQVDEPVRFRAGAGAESDGGDGDGSWFSMQSPESESQLSSASSPLSPPPAPADPFIYGFGDADTVAGGGDAEEETESDEDVRNQYPEAAAVAIGDEYGSDTESE